MSGYSGGSSNMSQNDSRFKGNWAQQIDPNQMAALTNLWGQASGAAGQAMGNMNAQLPGATNQANNTMAGANQMWGQQGQGGAYSNIDANKLQDQIYASMQAPTASQEINNMIMSGKGNNYADAMKSQYVQDANIAQQNMLNNLDARASASGLPGSSRQGITAGVGIQGINKNLQSELAQTGFNTFDKDLDRKLAIAGQADQANLARQNMLGSMLAGKQQAMGGALGASNDIANMGQNALNLQGMPMGVMGQLANIIGRGQVLSSGKQSGTSSGYGLGNASQSGGGLCYITTAITQALDEPDDGPTLTTLRAFRDRYMRATPERIEELKEYYETAPNLVMNITNRDDSYFIYKEMFMVFLEPALRCINAGDDEGAYRLYKEMVEFAKEAVAGDYDD